jgi:hypothetical protein
MANTESFLSNPSVLFRFPGELKLSANGLTGTIPESIGGLENLDDLDLHQNALTGQIPTSITVLDDVSKFVKLLFVIRCEMCMISHPTPSSFPQISCNFTAIPCRARSQQISATWLNFVSDEIIDNGLLYYTLTDPFHFKICSPQKR